MGLDIAEERRETKVLEERNTAKTVRKGKRKKVAKIVC